WGYNEVGENAPEAENQSGTEQESNEDPNIVDRTLTRINNEIRNDFSSIIPYLSDHEDGNVFFSHDPPFYLKFNLEGEDHILSWRILDLLYDNDKYLFGYGKYGLNYFVIPITAPSRKVTWVLIQKNIGDYLENKIVAYCDFDESKLFDYYYNDSEEWKTLQYENDIENFSIQVFHGEPDISLLPAVSDIIDRDATRRGTRIPGISIENIVKFNTQHIPGLPKFITVKSEETVGDGEPRFTNIFEYKRVYLKNLNGQEFPIIAYHQTVLNFIRDGTERLANTEALLILSSKHVWNYITYDTGHQFNYVFPLYITNVSNVTLEIDEGNIGYNLGPELYKTRDGTIYGRITIGYNSHEASEEIENPYLDYGYSDEDIKNEIKDYALREGGGHNKTIINLSQCTFQNIGLPYKLNALIGLRDEGEIAKEFHFKKIYMEMEEKTMFCYTDGPKDKSFYSFEDLDRYEFIIYIKDVWVFCNFKTRVVDGEQQYRILRGAICHWSLSQGRFLFNRPWILTNNNLTLFLITRPTDGIVETIDETVGGTNIYVTIEYYYNQIFDLDEDLPGQVNTGSQPAPIREGSSSNDNQMRLRREPLLPVDRGQAQPPTNRGTREPVSEYLNRLDREREDRERIREEGQRINRIPNNVYSSSSDDGVPLQPPREDAIVPELSNDPLGNAVIPPQDANFDDIRVINFRENTMDPVTNERVTIMDSKIYRPDVKPEQKDYSYFIQYLERK
ncbi:MAG: hypothetical protein HOE25_00650, partial [Flavobacteriales bacterium]|nr:hypothetical protein [Flavobacteriales bacterium]